MLIKILLPLLLSAVSVLASDAATRKAQELRARVLSSSEDIISLNAKEYKYFVEESPRPYDVVVFFTAPNCNMCDDVEAELSKVAMLYKQSGAIYPVNEGSKLRAVFFVKVTFEQSTRDIFVNFGFRSVPNLLVSQPKMLRLRTAEKAEHFRSFMWQISMSDGTLTSQKLLEHVNKKTVRNVEYKESVLNLLIVLVVFSGLLGFGVYLFIKFRPFFLNTTLWFLGSMVVYFICMSGIIYNILHSVPFTNTKQDGTLEWYHSGARSQFGAEGYVMSGAISTLGIVFILLFQLPKINEPNTVKLAYIVFFILIFLIIKFVENIYKAKSGFYNPIFFPPSHYIHGPLGNDQGNNI